MKKQHVKLSDADRKYLKSLIAKGKLPAKKFKRATGLLELDRGKTYLEVAAALDVSHVTVASWRKNYRKQGLKCLEDAPRSGHPIAIDGKQRAKITALACSEAPEGHARWNLRLPADKVIELGYCKKVSHTQVGKILKKTELKPHLNKTWCLGKINAQFIAQMELLLCLYALPYDRYYPVVCFDERPCFLIGEELDPLTLQSGQIRKEHYAYKKNGSAALLAAIEPLTGKRLARVYSQRTKKEYTLFCQELSALWPKQIKIDWQFSCSRATLETYFCGQSNRWSALRPGVPSLLKSPPITNVKIEKVFHGNVR
jgi:putative transposase